MTWRDERPGGTALASWALGGSPGGSTGGSPGGFVPVRRDAVALVSREPSLPLPELTADGRKGDPRRGDERRDEQGRHGPSDGPEPRGRHRREGHRLAALAVGVALAEEADWRTDVVSSFSVVRSAARRGMTWRRHRRALASLSLAGMLEATVRPFRCGEVRLTPRSDPRSLLHDRSRSEERFVLLARGALEEVATEHGLSWSARAVLLALVLLADDRTGEVRGDAAGGDTRGSRPLTLRSLADRLDLGWRRLTHALGELARAGLVHSSATRGVGTSLVLLALPALLAPHAPPLPRRAERRRLIREGAREDARAGGDREPDGRPVSEGKRSETARWGETPGREARPTASRDGRHREESTTRLLGRRLLAALSLRETGGASGLECGGLEARGLEARGLEPSGGLCRAIGEALATGIGETVLLERVVARGSLSGATDPMAVLVARVRGVTTEAREAQAREDARRREAARLADEMAADARRRAEEEARQDGESRWVAHVLPELPSTAALGLPPLGARAVLVAPALLARAREVVATHPDRDPEALLRLWAADPTGLTPAAIAALGERDVARDGPPGTLPRRDAGPTLFARLTGPPNST